MDDDNRTMGDANSQENVHAITPTGSMQTML
jgi:hypothetical protein